MNRLAMLAPLAQEELQSFTKDWTGKDGRKHSMTFTYIEDETVMDRLDAGYGPGNWQIQVDAHDPKVGIVKVRLGVRDTGEWVWYEDFGYATREGGEVLKEAVSDGIRRCGRYVGIARDLYRKATYEPGGALGPAAGTEQGTAPTPPPAEDQIELLGNLQKSGKAVAGGADKYKGDWWMQPNGHAIGFRLKLDGDDRDIPQVLINESIGEALFLLAGDKPLIGQQVTVKGKLYNVRPAGKRSYYRLIVGEHPDADFIETADGRIPAVAEALGEPLWTEPSDAEKAAAVAAELAEAGAA